MLFYLRRISRKLVSFSNLLLAVITIWFIITASVIAYLIEPETFGTWFTALWWVMTTLSTVGYGDYYPHTTGGRIFAILLYLFGIGLLSLVIGKIIDYFGTFKSKREAGKLDYPGRHHILIIHWNRKARYALDELLESTSKTDIVILDSGEKLPIDHPRVHFVSGDPASEAALEQAGIRKASSVLILADSRIEDCSLADGKSLMIASQIEQMAPHVHTTVEVMLESHIDNFRFVEVNDFILSEDAVARMAARSARHMGGSDIYRQLLSRKVGEDVYPVPIDSSWKTYREAFIHLLDQGATLIADRDNLGINRRLDEEIPPEARLYVICSQATYQTLMNKGGR